MKRTIPILRCAHYWHHGDNIRLPIKTQLSRYV